MFSQIQISIKMSVSTFGRVHQPNIEEINKKMEKDISNHIEEFLKKHEEGIWNKISEKIEECCIKSFDESQYNLSRLNTKILTIEKNLDDLYEEYKRVNTTTVREIYNQIDLNFKKSQEEIEKKASSEVLQQMKDSFNERIAFRNSLFYDEFERLVSDTKELNKKIFDAVIKSDNEQKKLSAQINAINKKINDEINTMNKKIDNEINVTNKKIDNEINVANKKIDDKGQNLGFRIDTLYEKIVDVTNTMNQEIDYKINETNKKIDVEGQNLVDRIDTMETKIDHEIRTINIFIEDKINEVYSSIFETEQK